MSHDDLDDDARFEIREGLEDEEIDDEMVVFDLEQDSYFSLNRVARLVWKALREGETFGAIVESIVEAYDDVDPDRARADAAAFLEEALSHDLVTRIDSSSDED